MKEAQLGNQLKGRSENPKGQAPVAGGLYLHPQTVQKPAWFFYMISGACPAPCTAGAERRDQVTGSGRALADKA